MANILDNKILVEGEVVLTRAELETLKCYMLICSVRNQSISYFCKILKVTQIFILVYIKNILS